MQQTEGIITPGTRKMHGQRACLVVACSVPKYGSSPVRYHCKKKKNCLFLFFRVNKRMVNLKNTNYVTAMTADEGMM